MRVPHVKDHPRARRVLLVLVLAFTAYDLVPRLSGGRAKPSVARSSGVHTATGMGIEPKTSRWDIYPSREEAAVHFREQLAQASEIKELSPCLDAEGRRTGEIAVIRLLPPHESERVWRVVWTYEAEDHSRLLSVESSSEQGARADAASARQNRQDQLGWTSCAVRE